MRAAPAVLATLLLAAVLEGLLAAAEPPIDPKRGRQLMRKFQTGDKWTPAEQAWHGLR